MIYTTNSFPIHLFDYYEWDNISITLHSDGTYVHYDNGRELLLSVEIGPVYCNYDYD